MTPLVPMAIAIAGEAMFSGGVALVRMAPDAVAGVLPAAVAPPSCRTECYGLLAFGQQDAGTTFFGGWPLPWGARYHELMFAIPFARWTGADGPQLFVLAMTCDFWPAVWCGNAYYGFNKRLAVMGWNGRRFVAHTNGAPSTFVATLADRNAAAQAGRASETAADMALALERVRAAAALPVLGRGDDGTFVRSRFEWDLSRATVEPAAATATSSGAQVDRSMTLMAGEHDIAWRIHGMKWRLSWPERQPPRRLSVA